MHNAGIIVGLANDLHGIKDLQKNETIGMETIKIANACEIAQHHNEKVECLRKDILQLDGGTRKLMEEVEI